MSIEKELANRRHKLAAADIQRRHRRAQDAAKRLQATINKSSPNGVNPSFADQLAKAAKRTKALNDSPAEDVNARIDRLRLEGKLPPKSPDADVGYEPTAEEVLGNLAVSEPISAPDAVESVPTVDEALEQDPAEAVHPLQLNPALRGAIDEAARATEQRLAANGQAGKTSSRRNRKKASGS